MLYLNLYFKILNLNIICFAIWRREIIVWVLASGFKFLVEIYEYFNISWGRDRVQILGLVIGFRFEV